MDSAFIHKSQSLKRKIESKGHQVDFLPSYSPTLNRIEQFWAIVKGKMKRNHMLTKENLSSRIADSSNSVPISALYGFCSHSKCQINNYYTKMFEIK